MQNWVLVQLVTKLIDATQRHQYAKLRYPFLQDAIVSPHPRSQREYSMLEPANPVKWAKVIDHTRCIGCHACTTACKSENLVPLSVTRTYVKHVDVGIFPQVRRAHQVTRCNQCAHAPCVTACPTSAMFKRTDG